MRDRFRNTRPFVTTFILSASACLPSASGEPPPNDTPAAVPVEPVLYAEPPTAALRMRAMHTARANHTATLLHDGRVLVVGGESLSDDRRMLASIEAYEPASDTWEDLAPLPEPRCGHTATLLADGRVLIVGGGRMNAIGVPSGLEVVSTALTFDPTDGTLTQVGDPVVARHGHVAVRIGSGEVLLVGGAGNVSMQAPSQGAGNLQPFGNALASAELFDPTTNTFRATGEMAQARYAFAGALLDDGRFLVSGGTSNEEGAESFDTAEVYDPARGSFAAGGVFDGADRLFHTMTVLKDGRVLAYGGKKSNVAFLDDGQLFDPTAATWVHNGNSSPGRTVAVSVPTTDGGALVIGGLSCSAFGCQVPPNVPQFATDGTVTQGPNLAIGRGAGTATVLDDGTVLVVGGYENDSLNLVELLVP